MRTSWNETDRDTIKLRIGVQAKAGHLQDSKRIEHEL